jgi:hypothetical protein
MPLITRLLATALSSRRAERGADYRGEPLDHPALSAASARFIDDLPLPPYALRCDGTISLTGGL